MKKHIIVHYGELRLKGRNRISFENKLINNIRKICGGRVEKLGSSLLCENSDINKFKYVSGISSYADCIKLNKNFDTLIKYFENIDKNIFRDKNSFAIKVKRSDKNFAYNSVEVGKRIGSVVFNKTGLSVDLKRPDITVYIEINEYILVYFDKMKGMGGFPAGIHGKVLCLLSGGIDSPVAAYYMMRKGCHVDLIHIHAFTDNNKVLESKINNIVSILNRYQLNSKLYILPSYLFDLNIFNSKDFAGYEMILFRKFIFMLAQRIALDNGYKALITGDSLGQVASQTLENLSVVRGNLNIQVLQPLIAMDKQEIIDLSKQIDTYDLSIQKYKDCCTLVSDRPVTRPEEAKINELQNKIDLEKIIDKTMSQLHIQCY